GESIGGSAGAASAVTERAASTTALAVATLRAAHQLFDSPRVLEDPVVLQLLDAEGITRIRENPDRFEIPQVRRLLKHVVMRSPIAEDRLAEAVARGVQQLIVLGAGFDTFAYRQPAWASALRIFEVDHPASREAKRTRLAAAGIEIPTNVEHVAIDF